MLSPVAGGWVGGVPHTLSGAYLQDYASYGYETSWVYRSHQGRVQCTGTITLACLIFSSHEHGVLSELLWSLTVRRCPSVRHPSVRPSVRPSTICLLTLASTNINQSSPNVVKMYMTTRAWMSFIMEPIGPELSELSTLEFENLPYLTMFTL